jgi:hypothetical protein
MYALPAGFAAARFDLGEPVEVVIVFGPAGPVPLVWSVEDCVRVRATGRLALTPVGQCTVKVESNGQCRVTIALAGS